MDEYIIGSKPQSQKAKKTLITKKGLETALTIGLTLKEIAKVYGISRRGLFKIRKKMGWPTRKYFKKPEEKD